jgi:hypothetical protein
MKMIVSNRNLAVQLGEFAYWRAINFFSSKNVTKDWLEMYETIIPVSVS